MWTAPKVASRDCGHCRAWQYDDKTGEVDHWLGKPMPRRGKVLCEYAKCPKGHWSAQRSLLPLNVKAVHYWRRCQAVGRFPDDDTVADHAAILSHLERMIENGKKEQFYDTLSAIVSR